MRSILIFVLLSLATPLSLASTGQVHGECHDGTKISLSLNTESCLSGIGTAYLIQKMVKFCADHCSPISGKCAVANMNGSHGQCGENGPEVMYDGFTAVCDDGQRVEFSACATEAVHRAVAARRCQNLQQFRLQERCN